MCSVGVQRQYTGTAGRVENSQAAGAPGVRLTLGQALIDRRLYLPETSWCNRPDHLAAAGVPPQVALAMKPALARQMITAAVDSGIPAQWVTADEVCGLDPACAPTWNSGGSATSWPSAVTDECPSVTAAPWYGWATRPTGLAAK